MKLLPRILMSTGIILLPAAPVLLADSDHTHRLSMQAHPLKDISTENGSVWDLSNNDRIRHNAPLCTVYGDTLLSETVEGERRWYALYADSAKLIREESRIHEHEPLLPLPTMAMGNPAPPTPLTYHTKGLHSHLFPIERTGTYTSHPPVKGWLIVTPQDTLCATMTCEECMYEEHTPTTATTDTAGHSTCRTRFTRYRWFTHGRVPVAVQTIIGTTGETDSDMETTATAYVMDFSPFSEDACTETENDGNITDHLLLRLLTDAKVSCHGGNLEVCLDAPVGTEVTLTLMSDAGVPYINRILNPDGCETFTIPCHSVPAGRHVLSLRAASIVEKRLIVID